MSEKKEPSTEASSNKAAVSFGLLLLALGLLYVGGWTLVWGKQIFSSEALLLTSDGFALRFNNLYYGASITKRFFDSPAISWLCLLAACGGQGGVFFFGSDDS